MSSTDANEHERKERTPQTEAASGSSLWRLITARIPLPFSVRSHLRWKPKPSWRTVILGAGLPRVLAVRTADVIRKSRLWPSERREVARELCAHFADGLEAGHTPEELIGSFGAVKPAAKLISRAARRKRPLWWKTWRLGLKGAVIGLLLCIGLYVVVFAMAMLGRPRVSRPYAVEYSAAMTTAPESERAWPLYAGIKKDLGRVPEELLKPALDANGQALIGDAADIWPQIRTLARWPLAVAWVDARQEPIDRLRRVALMPTLGCPLYKPVHGSWPWKQVSNDQGSDLRNSEPIGSDTAMISVLLPFCADARHYGRILVVDGRRAIELRDRERFAADVEGMIGLATQVAENRTLIGQLIRFSNLTQTCNLVQEGLAEDFLDASSLVRLGHRLGSTGESVRITFDAEKDFLLDTIQRAYTDNGSGGGYLTYEGMKQISQMFVRDDSGDTDQELELKLLSPITVLADAGREKTVAKTETIFARAQKEADTPFWLRGEGSMDIEVERVHDEGPAVARRYALLGVLMPAFGNAGVAGERVRQIRDGTLVAIALEAYRKRNGMYPGSLDALVPGFLPAIPPDRYDGRALKYRLVGDAANAKPIVYSIGVDRVDDNGLGPVRAGNEINMTGYRGPATIKAWLASPQMALSYRGDWVLYDPGHLGLRLQEVKAPKQRAAHPRGEE